jgi:hypothetical protein
MPHAKDAAVATDGRNEAQMFLTANEHELTRIKAAKPMIDASYRAAALCRLDRI